MNESSSGELKFQNSATDWALRAVVFAVFVFFGGGKFRPETNSAWIQMFNEIGFGQWFRFATGVLELLGAFLMLFPQTVSAGLAVLGTTMVGAILIDLPRPAPVCRCVHSICILGCPDCAMVAPKKRVTDFGGVSHELGEVERAGLEQVIALRRSRR